MTSSVALKVSPSFSYSGARVLHYNNWKKGGWRGIKWKLESVDLPLFDEIRRHQLKDEKVERKRTWPHQGA